MRYLRGFGAGVCLALALAGCSTEPKENHDSGVYSPLIVGISADHEPAIRGVTNELTVLVTNVNGYPITYHWSAAQGTLLDSTSATVGWVAPDSLGTYAVTASIEAVDGSTNSHFFKTTTFQIVVDNEYARWTTSPEVQFDPAPVGSGGLVFAQFSNIANGQADIYYIPGAGLAPEQRTTGFFTANSPTMKADGSVLAFAAKATDVDSQQVWIAPAAAADMSTSGTLTTFTNISKIFGNPRFARTGGWLMYNSDSGQNTGTVPRPLFRDIPGVPLPGIGINLPAPERVVADQSLQSRTFWLPNWGPDVDADGLPDSVVCMAFRFFRATNQVANGFYKFATRPENTSASQWLADSSASDPDWSKDGQYIVFADPNTKGGERDIWIIRSDTNLRSAAIRVTSGPADDSHPRFSSDGTTIYFVSNRANNYGLNGIYNTERRGYNIWGVTRFDRP